MKVQETKLRQKCFPSGNMSNCRSTVNHTLSNCISIDKIISYLVKYLDSIVFHITHDYPSITKTCCRNWIIKLAFPATFTSKFCNKLSTQFKYLNSVIRPITDQTISNPSLLTDKYAGQLNSPSLFPCFPNLEINFPSRSNSLMESSP